MNKRKLELLELIQSNGGTMLGSDLWRTCNGLWQQATLFHHLSDLEDMGHITSERVPAMRSQRRYRITESGRRSLDGTGGVDMAFAL